MHTRVSAFKSNQSSQTAENSNIWVNDDTLSQNRDIDQKRRREALDSAWERYMLMHQPSNPTPLNPHDKIKKIIRDERTYPRAARNKKTRQLAEELARNKEYHLNPHFDISHGYKWDPSPTLRPTNTSNALLNLTNSLQMTISNRERLQRKAEREADRDAIK